MLSISTAMFYEDLKDLSIEELEMTKHRCSDKLSWLYHEMSGCITKDDKEKFNTLNNESINTHNKLSACIILINHKNEGLI